MHPSTTTQVTPAASASLAAKLDNPAAAHGMRQAIMAMIDKYEAELKRLRSELEAEQARTICAMCGEELTRIAKVTP